MESNDDLVMDEKIAEEKKNFSKLSKWFLAAILLSICWVGYEVIYIIKIENSFIHAYGYIADIQEEESWSHRSVTYIPTVRYQNENGQEKTFKSTVGNNFSNYKFGVKVPIIYDRSDSARGYINDIKSLGSLIWFPFFMLIFFSVCQYFILTTKIDGNYIRDEELKKTETQAETIERYSKKFGKSPAATKNILKKWMVFLVLAIFIFKLLTSCSISIDF